MKRYWERKPKSDQSRTRTNQQFYKSANYRKARKAYLHENPHCEVCGHWGWVNAAEILEHLIPINFGGAKLNRENWMPVCRTHADQKSGMEAHDGCVLSWKYDEWGDKIPEDRTQLYKILRRPKHRGWVIPGKD